MFSQKDIDRFWAKVEKTTTGKCCWNWTAASKTTNGYGQFYVNRVNIRAHRFSFQLKHNRLIKEGMCILHSCDNPLCVNPNHLSEGTQQENITDRENKGRGVAPKGENQSSAKLKEFQVKEIRANYEKGQITYKQLANDYGVSDITIGHIIHRNTWKHI